MPSYLSYDGEVVNSEQDVDEGGLHTALSAASRASGYAYYMLQ